MKQKKSWREKLADDKGLPKVCDVRPGKGARAVSGRMVIAAPAAKLRRTTVSPGTFVKCLTALSADSRHLDWLVGRQLSDDHRAPAYDRIRRIMAARLRAEGVASPKFPQAAWVSHA